MHGKERRFESVLATIGTHFGVGDELHDQVPPLSCWVVLVLPLAVSIVESTRACGCRRCPCPGRLIRNPVRPGQSGSITVNT